MSKRAITTLAAAALLASCANPPPNTPGAGAGNTYTPVIDMGGVDLSRYATDLDECRRYASTINANEAGVSGAIGGAILLGVFSAALGGNSRMNSQAATAGGFAGLTGNTARAMNKQEAITGNCMAMRGYRVLDGSAAAPIAAYGASARPPTYSARPAQAAAPGSDQAKAEEIARASSCGEAPQGALTAGRPGSGLTIYSFTCPDGRATRVRCDKGVCAEQQ